MTLSDIVLKKNGSSALKSLYPLVKVLTKEDKASLAAEGYVPGFTAAEWPYDLPVEKIYYSSGLFPGTFYFDDGPVIPIIIDLHIVGSQRMKLQETSEEFCAFVKKTTAKLTAPTLEQISSYLLSLDDGFRTDVLEAYIRNSTPSPQLCGLFLACAIIQAGKLKLTVAELKKLCQAIVYHDIGRNNDSEDDGHGLAGRRIYGASRHDAVTAFLIEFHCRKDEDAYSHLQASGIKAKQRSWLLYQILKDADALDRIRFGIYELDVNYLRLPISHKLVPLAVAAETGIQL